MSSSERYRIETFLVNIDGLVAALSKRQKAYSKLKIYLVFFVIYRSLRLQKLRLMPINWWKHYPADIENEVTDELIQLSELLKTDVRVEFMSDDGFHDPYELRDFRFIGEKLVGSWFPNILC